MRPTPVLQRFGPRVVDLDIVFYGRETVRTERLEIPHPRLFERCATLAHTSTSAPLPVRPCGAEHSAKRFVKHKMSERYRLAGPLCSRPFSTFGSGRRLGPLGRPPVDRRLSLRWTLTADPSRPPRRPGGRWAERSSSAGRTGASRGSFRFQARWNVSVSCALLS